jgi:hypothetical protein
MEACRITRQQPSGAADTRQAAPSPCPTLNFLFPDHTCGSFRGSSIEGAFDVG